MSDDTRCDDCTRPAVQVLAVTCPKCGRHADRRLCQACLDGVRATGKRCRVEAGGCGYRGEFRDFVIAQAGLGGAA